MIEYACRHGIYYKRQQSCHYFAFDMYNREKIEPKILNIPLDNVNVREWEFPWLDTLMYMYEDSGRYYMTNCPTTNGKVLRMRSTSGNISKYDIPSDRLLHMETAFALLYGGKRSPRVAEFLDTRDALVEAVNDDDNSIVSDWSNSLLADIIKEPNSEPSRYKRLFINNQPEDGQVEINGEFYNEEDCVLDVDDNWVHCDDAVEVNGDWYHTDDDRVVYTRGEYYHRDEVTYVESRNEYYPNDDTTYCEYNNDSIHIDDAVYVEDYGYVHEDDIDEVAVYVDGSYYKIQSCFECAITEEWFRNRDKHQLPDGRAVCEDAYNEWMEENDTDEEEVEEQP